MVGKGDPPAPREDDDDEDAEGVVKLISAEGFEFVVDKKAAMVASPRRARAKSASRRSPPTSSRRSASISTGRSITPVGRRRQSFQLSLR
ncbi:unnamed protein product [Urochloa humidicola]